jgi:hypothetical protein
MVCTRPGTMVPPDSFNITDAHRLGIGLLEQVWTTDAEPDKNGTLTSPTTKASSFFMVCGVPANSYPYRSIGNY